MLAICLVYAILKTYWKSLSILTRKTVQKIESVASRKSIGS